MKIISSIAFILFFFASMLYPQTGMIQIYQMAYGQLGPLIWADSSVSESYKIILPFKHSGSNFILFYNREEGKIDIKNQAGYSTIATIKNLPTHWEHIVAINTDDTLNDMIFIYSKVEDKAFVYKFDPFFNFLRQGEYDFKNIITGKAIKYLHVIPFHLYGTSKVGVLMYSPFGEFESVNYNLFCNSPSVSRGDFFDISINTDGIITGNPPWVDNVIISLHNTFDNWRGHWDYIKEFWTPGKNPFVFFYDSFHALGEIYEYSSTNFKLMRKFDGNLRRTWNNICGGKFLTGNDLFFYEKQTPLGEFYHIDADYDMQLLSKKTYFKENWSIIETLPSPDMDMILFYRSENNQEICIPTYDTLQQPVHPDIMYDENMIKLTFTPYTFINDKVENPSILFSKADNVFKNFAGVINPLANTPLPLGAYNNDPTFFKEGDTTYIFYLATYNDTLNGYTELNVLKSTNNFSHYTQSTIFTQNNTDNLYYLYSPSLIKNNEDGLYYMFWANYFGTIFYQTSNSINSWMTPMESDRKKVFFDHDILNIENNLLKFAPWHLKVIENKKDGFLYMLIAGKFEHHVPVHFPQENLNLYIARSHEPGDMAHWILYPEPILNKDILGYTSMYRSTALFTNEYNPAASDNSIDIYYSFFKGQKLGMGVKKNFQIHPEWFDLHDSNLKKKVLSSTTNENKMLIYPNPFNSYATIRYTVTNKSLICIELFDLLGRRIETFISEEKQPGEYVISFNGNELSSGIYFCRLINGNKSETKKIVLLK